MKKAFIFASMVTILCLWLLPGCVKSSPTSNETRPSIHVSTISPTSGNVIVNIDWVDFIRFNGITYLRTFQPHFGFSPYTEEELKYSDKIRFRVEGNVTEPGYKIKDGDAAYLDEGTPIYSIKGYSPDFRLVAKVGEELYLFEADTNPKAEKGEDLLDIRDKVETISINSPVDGRTTLAAITDEEVVSRLVDMVLEAPVDQTDRASGSDQIFIEFNLYDGTSVNRGFLSDTGNMERGIMLPDDFWEMAKPYILTK